EVPTLHFSVARESFRGTLSYATIPLPANRSNMGPRSVRVLSALLLAGLPFGCGGGSISSSSGGRVTTPSAPTALVAMAGNQQISLAWAASTGATSYHLKRATTSGGPYAQVGSTTATGYADTGLTNGTEYFYVVSAVNTAGESTNSTPAS